MDILEAKQAVIAAGLKLLETGLIARTWGNVSARVDDESFVITPSGKAYEGLTPDDVVLVKIKDLSYAGDVKPSSEKGIHAQAYALRPEVGFVIHTHQKNASIVSVTGGDLPLNGNTGWWADVLGETVPLAAYGLPGTGKLRKGVTAALKKHPGAKAVLMAHHGALCVGQTAEEAFKAADALEQASQNYLARRLLERTGDLAETIDGIHALIAKRRAENAPAPADPAPTLVGYTSFRSGDAFSMKPEAIAGEYVDVSLSDGKILNEKDDPQEPETLELHRAIYRKNSKVNAIVHSAAPDIQRTSHSGAKKLLPYLDDFAQIAGVNLRVARFNPNDQLESAKLVNKALKGRSAVLLEGNGALCIGSNLEEARAVETVAEKNCGVSLSADLFAKAKPIGLLDAAIMRLVYVQKYAKKK
ncbi:MAG: class II aldolase/adducin family protein [Oscillospiraceae bacterium]|jgi:L-fuculose-phosphate aldolase|nr:class II aldolase/adducin family protein [Oscillospiraceae bacterium]